MRRRTRSAGSAAGPTATGSASAAGVVFSVASGMLPPSYGDEVHSIRHDDQPHRPLAQLPRVVGCQNLIVAQAARPWVWWRRRHRTGASGATPRPRAAAHTV